MKIKTIEKVKPKMNLVANTDFKIVGADSGRNQTGFHNLPNGDCKGFYTSRFKGGCFLMPDLSAAEVKMVAGTAGETKMIQAFKDGLDIHNFNASVIFDIPIILPPDLYSKIKNPLSRQSAIIIYLSFQGKIS